jgi:hypothetical protein
MILNYLEYNEFYKYDTYDDWDDEDTELNNYIKKVSSYLSDKYKKIDFKQIDIKEFVETCM